MLFSDLSASPVPIKKSRRKKLEKRENKELADARLKSQEENQLQQKQNCNDSKKSRSKKLEERWNKELADALANSQEENEQQQKQNCKKSRSKKLKERENKELADQKQNYNDSKKSRSKKLEERENKELADALPKSQEENEQQQKQNCNDSSLICPLAYSTGKDPNTSSAFTAQQLTAIGKHRFPKRVNSLSEICSVKTCLHLAYSHRRKQNSILEVNNF